VRAAGRLEFGEALHERLAPVREEGAERAIDEKGDAGFAGARGFIARDDLRAQRFDVGRLARG
jgi:hypothetical protein